VGLKVQIRKASGEIEAHERIERIIFTPENLELISGTTGDRRRTHTIPTRLIAQGDIRDDEPGSELALSGGDAIVRSGD
jgi:hypothetical protein